MRRMLLMSILFCTVIVPALLSKDKNPQRGMKRTMTTMFVLIVIWGYSCRTFYYRLAED